MRWQTWETNLPGKVEVPRSIVQHQKATTSISIHAFGDVSSQGVSTAVNAVNASVIRGITRTRDSKVKTREEGINNTKTRAGGWAYDT